ncbi:TetR family transcriptional regulator|uniref:TetR family transcriptional regulator n=1 Tax=Leuconostoc lactis TaxID=1246 RepID=A0A6L7ADY4_LEULA|nr:TetR family transcriptional regulator [Leuconostoc lactis]
MNWLYKLPKSLSIADNFRQVIGDLVVILNQPLGRALITVLIDQPERVTAFQTTFFEVKRRAAKQLLTAGQAQHVIQAAKTAIIQATISLLDTVPFSNLTIEAIAKQSGVSKATIYRWWPNKEALLFAAFLHVTTVDVNFEPPHINHCF